jgi:flagellar protein FliO/FliZ
MKAGSRICRPLSIALALSLSSVSAIATEAAQPVATGGLATGDLVSASLRMAAGLVAVLALLGATVWLSRRFQLGTRRQAGLIEIQSGISLGAREKVVLLRVGREQVLVGVSPAGMRTLHVIGNGEPAEFGNYMDETK